MGGCFDEERRNLVVFKAIDQASAQTVRSVLKNLLAVAPNVKQIVEDALLAVEESGSEGSVEKKSGVDEDITALHLYEGNRGLDGTKKRRYGVLGPASRNKRVRPRFEICVQCEMEFDVTMNHEKACVWHDGDLEVDEDHKTWWDWDERCFGDMDSEENRDRYPEGFIWSCCDGDGTAAGCETSPHKEQFTLVLSRNGAVEL